MNAKKTTAKNGKPSNPGENGASAVATGEAAKPRLTDAEIKERCSTAFALEDELVKVQAANAARESAVRDKISEALAPVLELNGAGPYDFKSIKRSHGPQPFMLGQNAKPNAPKRVFMRGLPGHTITTIA